MTPGLQNTAGLNDISGHLSNSQMAQVQSILSEYDPQNLSSQDAQDIYRRFMQNNIQTGKDLRDTITEAGFDPQKLRTLASQAVGGPSQVESGSQLNTAQKQTVQSILEKFDPQNLTSSDARAIFLRLQQAGIPAGNDLRATLRQSGFDTERLASLASSGSAPQDVKAEMGKNRQAGAKALQNLQTILSQYDLENLNEEDQQKMLNELDQAGLLESGNVINISI